MTWSSDGRRLAFTLADPEAAAQPTCGSSSPTAANRHGSPTSATPLPRAGSPIATATRPRACGSARPPRSRQPVLDLPAGEEIASGRSGRGRDRTRRGACSCRPSTRREVRHLLDRSHDAGRGRGLDHVGGRRPYLAQHDVRDETYEFDNERPLFSDLRIDRDGFTSAAISWGSDGDRVRHLETRVDRRITGLGGVTATPTRCACTSATPPTRGA